MEGGVKRNAVVEQAWGGDERRSCWCSPQELPLGAGAVKGPEQEMFDRDTKKEFSRWKEREKALCRNPELRGTSCVQLSDALPAAKGERTRWEDGQSRSYRACEVRDSQLRNILYSRDIWQSGHKGVCVCVC